MFHRIPKNPETRACWLRALKVQENDVKSSFRVCSRHFPGGDPLKTASLALVKCFASPIKQGPRSERAKQRVGQKQTMDSTTSDTPVTPSCSGSIPVTPTPISPDPVPHQLLTAEVGEQLRTEYHVHELPSLESLDPPGGILQETLDSQGQLLESNTILLARVAALEAENAQLKAQAKDKNFRIEDIQHDDKLVRFYTCFVSYMVFLAFFEFLGPAAERLQYWGTKESSSRQRMRSRKLGPKNELFLTLVKLKLNLPHADLAFQFGISVTKVSCYDTTWICFMYQDFS